LKDLKMAKSKKNKKTFGYIVLSRSWYAAANKKALPKSNVEEEIAIFDLDHEGESSYEFRIEWHRLNDTLSPEVCLFEDSWKAFEDMPELFKVLAKYHMKNPSPKIIEAELKKLKLKDKTQISAP
jgi:hypothetical protein